MNPIVALIIANIIWGAGSPIFKLALTNLPVYTFVFARFFIAALIFLPFVLKTKQKLIKRDYLDLMLAGIFGVTIHISAYFLALQKTQSINAPIIASASPVFLFFLSILFLKEKINFKVLYGMLVSLIGVMVIVITPLLKAKVNNVESPLEGNLLLIIAVLFSLITVLIHKKLLNKINPYVVGFWTFLFGSIPLLPLVFNEFKTWSLADLNFYGSFGLIYGILLNTVLAYALYFYGMSKIKAQEVGTFTYVDPVIAILIAAPLLGEYPDKFFALGSFLVFLGLYLSEGRIQWHPFHRLKNGKI